jgi:hypothetical protein
VVKSCSSVTAEGDKKDRCKPCLGLVRFMLVSPPLQLEAVGPLGSLVVYHWREHDRIQTS